MIAFWRPLHLLFLYKPFVHRLVINAPSGQFRQNPGRPSERNETMDKDLPNGITNLHVSLTKEQAWELVQIPEATTLGRFWFEGPDPDHDAQMMQCAAKEIEKGLPLAGFTPR